MSRQHIFTLLILIPLTQMELPILKNTIESLRNLKNGKKQNETVNCGIYSPQLTSVLSLMCTVINAEDVVIRNACIGCFRTASTSNNNQPSLSGLNECAQMYLPESRYETCLNLIDASAPVPVTTGCVQGYCRFVRCIRRINSDILIAQCYSEAIVNNDVIFEEEQVMFYKNVTSCILARSRCSSLNPITGQQQSSQTTTTTYNLWGIPSTTTVPISNSLQITPEGDLRIINLPGTTKIQPYFCVPEANLQESSWLEFSC